MEDDSRVSHVPAQSVDADAPVPACVAEDTANPIGQGRYDVDDKII